MIEKESEWILPENLRKKEKIERKKVDEGSFQGEGDFGSYYAYRKGINLDFIKPHAISIDKNGFEYVNNLSSYLSTLKLNLHGNVLDVACSIGTITDSLRLFNHEGLTYGLDISEDAIEVAKQKYPDCKFYCQSADKLDNFENGYFDIIHAREFYPFTRTNDRDYHLKYLSLFFSKTKPNGYIVLQITIERMGFCNTFKSLSSELKTAGFSNMRGDAMVPRVLFLIFGRFSYVQPFYALILLLIKLKHGILGRGKFGYFYLLKKG